MHRSGSPSSMFGMRMPSKMFIDLDNFNSEEELDDQHYRQPDETPPELATTTAVKIEPKDSPLQPAQEGHGEETKDQPLQPAEKSELAEETEKSEPEETKAKQEGIVESPAELAITTKDDFHKMDDFVQNLMSKLGNRELESGFVGSALKSFAQAQPEGPEDKLILEKQVHEELKANNFEFLAHAKAGNPWGGRWQRALASDEKLKADYSEKKGHTAKARFRATWGKGKYEQWVSSTTYTEKDEKKRSRRVA